jgi:hypothetical protein
VTGVYYFWLIGTLSILLFSHFMEKTNYNMADVERALDNVVIPKINSAVVKVLAISLKM